MYLYSESKEDSKGKRGNTGKESDVGFNFSKCGHSGRCAQCVINVLCQAERDYIFKKKYIKSQM